MPPVKTETVETVETPAVNPAIEGTKAEAAKPEKKAAKAKPKAKNGKSNPKAPAETKAIAKTKTGKTAAPAKKSSKLGINQLKVLKILAKAKGPMTRRVVYTNLEKSGTSFVMGRIPDEAGTYNGLVEKGYARQVTFDAGEKKVTGYEITAAGKKFLEKA